MGHILVITLLIILPQYYARSPSLQSEGREVSNVIDSPRHNGASEGDLVCVDKLMMVEYTELTEVTTCVHKTQTRQGLRLCNC